MLCPPLPRGDLVYIFKGPGKMQLAGISHRIADIPDGQVRQLQKLRRLGHPVADQKLLGTLTHGVPENLAKIAAVQIAKAGDVLHGDVVLEILFHKGDRLPDIEIPDLAALHHSAAGRGSGQIIHKQV